MEKNVWVEVTKRKAKGKEVKSLPVVPSPQILKEEGSSSQVVHSPLASKVGHSSPIGGKGAKVHSTAIAERKILLDKIRDLQFAKEGSNLDLRRSSRCRMPPISLSGEDFIVPWKGKEKVIPANTGGEG